MRQDLTDLTVVMDRSGSMQACKVEAEGGLNHFIEEQVKHPGECLFTLIQFDDVYEFVIKGQDIKAVPKCEIVPRGWTALLDAVGKAINETGERLSTMQEEQRPGLVVIVIVTDGLENSSREFTKTQIKEMIERQTKDYNWQFIFLGANQDAFIEAHAMGIPLSGVANYKEEKTSGAFCAAASYVNRMRTSSAKGYNVSSCCFSDEERKSMS